MEFAKLHGLGNDFLVIRVGDAGGVQRTLSSLSTALCHRHLGVGADGVVYYQPTIGDPEADVSALIFNADGSRAEMSGNGLRCLVAYLCLSGQHQAAELRVRTVAGVKTLTLKERSGKVLTFETSMGCPITEPERIPMRPGPASGPVIDWPLTVGIDTVSITASSMGNPHCSTFWPDVAKAPLDTLGPLLERHSAFPNRTNVEFIQVIEPHRIRVRFWERGVGHTMCSGTGSSGAAVASILRKEAVSPVTVETELGSLLVRWDPPGELYLTGPAEFICSGSYPEGDTVIEPS
jgi:diaminopimelate epimerase